MIAVNNIFNICSSVLKVPHGLFSCFNLLFIYTLQVKFTLKQRIANFSWCCYWAQG